MGGMNLYQYAPNPTGWVDPLGLSNISCTCPNGEVIELTPDEKAMNDLIDKDAKEHVETKSKTQLGKDAAISRATANGKTTESFVNIKPKISKGKVQGMEGVFVDSEGIVNVTNKKQYLDSVESLYKENGADLHPKMRQRIGEHIDTLPNGKVQSMNGGLPGLHAEVRSTNSLMNDGYKMNEISVGTNKVGKSNPTTPQGAKFEACSNCDGILNGHVNKITTGTSSNNVKN